MVRDRLAVGNGLSLGKGAPRPALLLRLLLIRRSLWLRSPLLQVLTRRHSASRCRFLDHFKRPKQLRQIDHFIRS